MARRKNLRFFRLSLKKLTWILLGGLLVFVLVGFYKFQRQLKWVNNLKSHYAVVVPTGPHNPPAIALSKHRPPQWTDIHSISPVAVAAIVVSEDWAFYEHKGFDPNQMFEAFKLDIKRGHFARGASTITQQVARNLFLEKDKNLLRKIKEIIIATQIEKSLTKSKILEFYLNSAEWGDGIYGIAAASQLYFYKSPALLTAKEGAFLAMLLPSPKRYSRSFFQHHLSNYAQETIDSILGKMVQTGKLSQDERERQSKTPLSFER
jgi:monofunctional biosynthetic peptidoglycan transglycosylase